MAERATPEWEMASQALGRAETACWEAYWHLRCGDRESGRDLAKLVEAVAQLIHDLDERAYAHYFADRPPPARGPRGGVTMQWPWSRRKRPQTEAEALVSIRTNLAALGYPMNGYTDAEIVQAVQRFGRLLAQTMVTAAEAKKGWSRMLACGQLRSPEET